ncbi:MAG TPA: GGDEF domain-containing protein [Devosia sp.]|nr:GGDEF domain-containing protein [Devosia sp.]
MTTRLKLSRTAWRSILLWTALVVAATVPISILLSDLVLAVLGRQMDPGGVVLATVMPILMSTPAMFYITLHHQRLKCAMDELDVLASTDWLTATLNRRAFTTTASALLEPGSGHLGTLLVVDADNFKTVNDRFGHEAGDAALKLMVQAIEVNLRAGDLVGRIGGEEFGVFLIDADYDTAMVIAERIRVAVAAVRFAPGGIHHPLSVSIGGATAIDRARFGELFRIADQQLYGAKARGRNGVALARLSPSIDIPANRNDPAPIDKTADIRL